jgi:protein TonB
MSHYRGTAEGPDQAKAIAAVLLVHAGLGAAILAGLNVETVHRAIEGLKTFDVPREVPPPPPPPPPPSPKEASKPKDAEGAAGKKAEPTPIVAPKPRLIPTRSPVAAAPVAGRGSASTAGAAASGTGTGAGGQGLGRGGGGLDYSRFTPAQRISRIPNREYRRLVDASGRERGSIGITLKVNTDGSPSHCRIARTSGDPSVDGLMCQLALRYVRFRPARDPEGRAVAQDITWYPDWAPN